MTDSAEDPLSPPQTEPTPPLNEAFLQRQASRLRGDLHGYEIDAGRIFQPAVRTEEGKVLRQQRRP